MVDVVYQVVYKEFPMVLPFAPPPQPRPTFTPRDLLQAAILRAYYDGRHDQARARMGHPDPTGLDNPPDDAMVQRLLHEDDDTQAVTLRARAQDIAESVLVALGIATP